MASITLQCSPKSIQQMETFYTNKIKTPPYALFSAKTDSATITAYQSGKVVFQGKNPEAEAQKWGDLPLTSKTENTNLPTNFATLNIIGSDETGNGSYFGPLTVCATYVTNDTAPTLKKLGVKDSKQLSDERMKKIAPLIKETIPYQLLVVTPEKYNQVQSQYNAVKMKAVLHNRAIALLEQKIVPCKPDGILIDQFTDPKNYQRYIQNEDPIAQGKLYFATKGEQYHLSVAAASIIARVAFLEGLETDGHKVGLETLPSGAGPNVDRIASQLITRYGDDILYKISKYHFANTKKAQQLAHKNKDWH